MLMEISSRMSDNRTGLCLHAFSLQTVVGISNSLLKVLQKFQITNAEAVKNFVAAAHVNQPKHEVNSVLKIMRDIEYEAPEDPKDERVMFHATRFV
jgi:hypothetical protein